jgi:hypothetical protein
VKFKMKGKKGGETPAEIFARGFIAAGLLTAIQDRKAPADHRKTLRHAVQGGAALAAGVFAARALARRRYGMALGVAAVGAAGVWAAQALLQDAPADDVELIADGETEIGQEVGQEG